MHFKGLSCITIAIIAGSACADPPTNPSDLYVKVLDVGGGLACVVRLPDSNNEGFRYLIYDTGHWNTDNAVLESVQEIIPEGSEIDLLVLSHSDSDHLGATDEILDAYKVKRILRTGMHRTTTTWKDSNDAILDEKKNDGAVDINLQYFEYPPGGTYKIGDTFVTFVCGFGQPLKDWGLKSSETSMKRNAVSIVIRVIYNKKSILFCGDAVGRRIGDPDNVCIATERFMVDMSSVIPIDSDVLIAPHHGADNGSSIEFIEAVSPEFVIFGAGHAHGHPRQAAADRYIFKVKPQFRVDPGNMFRTDLGDDERPKAEWDLGRIDDHSDKSGDDAVEIVITAGGDVTVQYGS